MNLNKKGYMLVEIVIAFGIAMAIAYYLMNLTYKFKNTNEDIYQSTIYLKDKVSVTKNIMNDLEKSTIVEYNKCNDTNQNCIMLKTQDGTEKKIEAKKDETTGVIKIIYGDIGHSQKKVNQQCLAYHLSVKD